MKWELVTEEQKQYIKDNFWKMTKCDMANTLEITENEINYIYQKLKLSKLWKYDDEKLIKLCDGTRSYLDIQKEMPHRTKGAIEMRCNQLKINHLVKRENSDFTVQELESFKLDYPKYSNKELSEIYSKTENQINGLARTLNLQKDYFRETNAKRKHAISMNNYFENYPKGEYEKFIKKIKNIKSNNDADEIYSFYSNISRKYISRKIYETINFSVYDKKSYVLLFDNNTTDLVANFKMYKSIINNKKYNGKGLLIKNKETLILLFKYYLKMNNITPDRKFLIKLNYGRFLEKAKLKSYIKSYFSGYYDFITKCYPKYNLYPWEFKILDVENGFYQNKFNRMWLVKQTLEYLKESNIINTYSEILQFVDGDLILYFGNSLDILYGIKEAIIEYFDFNNIFYDKESIKIFNNVRFDSLEELNVYKCFYKLGFNIKKCKKNNKIYNKEKLENYIPDFEINYKGENIICEYYGLYNKNSQNSILKTYREKMKRKNIFYNKNFEYFIAIYPPKNKHKFNEDILKQINTYFNKKF